MVELAIPKPTIDLAPTTSLLGGSPKSMYVYFLLGLCKNYFEIMSCEASSDFQLENASAALIAFCPNRAKREELWEMYITKKKDGKGNVVTASVLTIGELISYLSDTLEFEEQSTGGLM